MEKRESRLIRLRPRTQRDLDEISQKAAKTAEQIVKKLNLLYEFPLLGCAMDQAYEGYRQLLSGQYRIIYQIMSDTEIEVAYIRHCSRQLQIPKDGKDELC